MAIKYCDFENGSDTTGDGSAGNPYQTIQTASVGLSGGDEVRVAKSPDDEELSGDIYFEQGSSAVVGDGTAFTTELSANDYIMDGNGLIYPIASIEDDSNLTLKVGYAQHTTDPEAPETCYKVGVIDTGVPSSEGEQVQYINVSGISESSRLKVSGGWDLGSETQTGRTNFANTDRDKQGIGLRVRTGKQYLEIEKLGFFGYWTGLYLQPSEEGYHLVKEAWGIECYWGIFFNSYNVLDLCMAGCCDSSNFAGVWDYYAGSSNFEVKNFVCYALNNERGFDITHCHYVNVHDGQIYESTVYIEEASHWLFENLTGYNVEKGSNILYLSYFRDTDYVVNNCQFENGRIGIEGSGEGVNPSVIISNCKCSNFAFDMVEIIAENLECGLIEVFGNMVADKLICFGDTELGQGSGYAIEINAGNLPSIVVNNLDINACVGDLYIDNLSAYVGNIKPIASLGFVYGDEISQTMAVDKQVFGDGNIERDYDNGRGAGSLVNILQEKNLIRNPDEDDNFQNGEWVGQTFTPTITAPLSRLELFLKKTGSPTADTIVDIYETDENGHPTQTLLARGRIPMSALTSEFAWVGVDFEELPVLTAETVYAFVIYGETDYDESNLVDYAVNVEGDEGNYERGDRDSRIDYEGWEWDWYGSGANDFLFKTYQQGMSKPCVKFIPSSADNYIYQTYKLKAVRNTAKTISYWLKTIDDFDGVVEVKVKIDGVIISAWTNKTPSVPDEYELKTTTISAEDIVRDGVVEVTFRVNGTTGSVCLDDLSAS